MTESDACASTGSLRPLRCSHLLQVSHHPPVACVHAAGPGYAVLGEMMLVSSFWGKAITMKNEGGITAELTAAGERYAWRKPTFTINNIILGKPWIEAVGTTSVTCSNGAPQTRPHVVSD